MFIPPMSGLGMIGCLFKQIIKLGGLIGGSPKLNATTTPDFFTAQEASHPGLTSLSRCLNIWTVEQKALIRGGYPLVI